MISNFGRYRFILAYGLKAFCWVPRVEDRPALSRLRIEASCSARLTTRGVIVYREFHTLRAFLYHVWCAVVDIPAVSGAWMLHPQRGAVTIDTKETSNLGHNSATSPLTWTFANGAGTEMVIGQVVTVNGSGDTTLGAVSYAGTAATAITGTAVNWDTTAGGFGSRGQMYHITTPATGSNTVSVAGTWTLTPTTTDILGGAITFTGAAGTYANATTANTTSANTTATVTVPSTTAGNLVVDLVGTGSGVSSSNQTLSWSIAGSTHTGGDNAASSTAAAGGSIVMSYTVVSDIWGIAGVEVQAGAGPVNALWAASLL